MPKLRPRVILPPMTRSRPSAEALAVTMSGSSPGASPARSSGGPMIDTAVVIAAAVERSMMLARRRITVNTTINASLTSSSRPVIWPVRTKSASRFIHRSANNPPTSARAARSRQASRNMTAVLPLALNRVGRVAVDEVRRTGAIHQLARDRRLDATVAAERDDLIEQIARMARPERASRRLVMPALQIGNHDLVEGQMVPPAVQLEDPRELLDARIDDRDLVGDAAQECLVGQRRRREVRREDGQHVERHLNLLPGVQREIVDAALERHDPSVEQILRAHALAAEVVDQEHAAVRLQLDRRFVELRERVEGEVEHVERQLAADDDDRTLDADPPAVARRGGKQTRHLDVQLERLVVDWIAHRHHVPVDVDRMRDVHVAAERAAHAFRQHRLAVSGRSVEKHALAHVHGRAELLEDVVADDQMLEALREAVTLDV